MSAKEEVKAPFELYLASLLYDAIDDANIEEARTFLDKGAHPNTIIPSKGIAPIHLAIGIENEEFAYNITNLLLQRMGDPNVRTDDGLTPLHIAAAYGRCRILKLLLCCGGDPMALDVNHLPPMYYAHEQNFPECIKLLKKYSDATKNLWRSSHEKSKCNVQLDKIIVNNGTTEGDYQVIQEYKTDALTQKTLDSLQNLPDTDTTEYVLNWCRNHQQNILKLSPEQEKRVDKSDINTNGNSCFCSSDFCEGSFNESDNEKSICYNVNEEKITFRKVYRKKRISSPIKTPTKKSLLVEDIDQTPIKDVTNKNDHSQTKDFTQLNEFSTESGISNLSTASENDSIDKINPTNNIDELNKNVSVITINSTSPSNDTTIVTITDETSHASSDYKSCTSKNDNILEQNIYEITQDVSKIDLSINQQNSTPKPDLADISFVSVSEVYKYVDEEQGIVFYERRYLRNPTSDYAGSIKSSSLSSKLSSVPATVDYDTDTLRRELTLQGYNPGPITLTTKRVYLRKLKQLKLQTTPPSNDGSKQKVFSIELEKTLKDDNWIKDMTVFKLLEETLSKEFCNPNPTRKWREGVNKSSFTYLLLDPRKTNNLPCRSENLDSKEVWETFLNSIFYVGKGKRSRPYAHLYESIALWNKNIRDSPNKKLNHILDIWNDGYGVICLHIFQNVIPVEAYTREAAMLSALKIENLTNIKTGDFYGIVSTWSQKQKKMLGVYLLYKAMMIFLNEGERQLCPNDID